MSTLDDVIDTLVMRTSEQEKIVPGMIQRSRAELAALRADLAAVTAERDKFAKQAKFDRAVIN